MSSDIQPYQPKEISNNIDVFTEGISGYLSNLGLPYESVLVELKERKRILINLPSVIEAINDNKRESSMYISKFIVACSVGLFDAALNYLWDETIRNIREKIARFDLDYFYASVITDTQRRSKFKDESDLEKLQDWELIKGCLETGIIRDIGYKHLDYIRDMRNYASAAHPNQNQLRGLQLVDWLETCITEVIAKEPEGSAIKVRTLLRNLREQALLQNEVQPINLAVQELPDDLSRSLLRSIFGMYTDPNLGATPRNNIILIAKAVWEACPDDARYEAGIKHDYFSANGETSKAKSAREFLESVNGVAYLSSANKALEMDTALNALENAHEGWNNFHHEPTYARNLSQFVPESGEVPDNVLKKYVYVLTMCRIGNGNGLPWNAKPIYDNLISRWRNQHIAIFIQLIANTYVSSRLGNISCANNYKDIAKNLKQQTTHKSFQEVLEILAICPESQLEKIKHDSRLKRALKEAGIRLRN